MEKDKSDTKGLENKQPAGAAFSGPVLAPMWIEHESPDTEPRVTFMLTKIGDNDEPSGLFQPVDLFDILEVIEMLAEQSSRWPLLEERLRASLAQLSEELAQLNHNQDQSIEQRWESSREVPPLKVVTSQKQ